MQISDKMKINTYTYRVLINISRIIDLKTMNMFKGRETLVNIGVKFTFLYIADMTIVRNFIPTKLPL